MMKNLLLLTLCAVGIPAYALPIYEPFTEYSDLVASPGSYVSLATSGFYVTNGPVVEQWGGGSSGFGLFFAGTAGTGITNADVVVTNNGASVFTSANLAAILPSGFPGAGSDINITAFVPIPANANTVGNSAVLKFAQDITRPTSGVTTLYVSYLLDVTGNFNGQTGAGNVGRYGGFLSQTNIYEGWGSGGAYLAWGSLFNTFGASPNYVAYGYKINSPTIPGGDDILASDSSGANSPSSGNAGVGAVYNTANFVVGCFSFSSDFNDTNTVWVNPPLADFGGPTPSSVNLNAFKMGTVMSDVGAFFLESRAGGAKGGIGPTFIGNLLIGTTWSYVTGGPEFTNQPASVTISSTGGAVSFTGDAVAAAQSVSYQWQHVVGAITNNLTDGVGTAGGGATVSGSATDDLTLNGVTAGDIAGFYQLVATASATSFTMASQPASIIYHTDPFILSNPSGVTTNYGGTATFTATAETLQATMSYQWFNGTTPLVDGLQADGSTVSGASGTVSSTSLTTTLNLANVTYLEDGNYSVLVTNNVNNAVSSSPGTLTVIASSPTIISQLPLAYTNQFNLLVGATPTFSVTASGALPIYYQWYSNSVPIVGATNASFTLTNAQTTSSGSYYCLASNFVGTTSSSTLNLSVLATGAPYPLSVMALNPVGYWRLKEGPADGYGNQNAVCFDYARGDNGLYTNVFLAEPGYNPVTDPSDTSALFGEIYYSQYDNYAGQIAGVDFSASAGNSVAFTVEAWENGYPENKDAAIVAKQSYGNGGEQFVLDVHNGVYRFFVRDASGTAHAVSSTVSPVYGQWHHLAGVCDESNGVIALFVDGALAGSGVIAPGSGILTATNPVTIGSRNSGANIVNDDQLHGNVNDVAVYGSALTGSQVAAQYFGAGIAPRFTQLSAPEYVTVNQNGTLTFPALVIGTSPLSYQWYDANTSLALSGQTNATLVISNIQNGGAYYLIVTNLYGLAPSAAVSVNVNSGPPVITQDLPPRSTTLVGRTYTYAVGVQGTEPLLYTWYRNSSPIAGQTGSAYTFSAASGAYSVAISNTYAGVLSTVSTMTAVTSPTDAYATNILGMNPVGYWPLQETNAPAPANMETNYGSLGALATAYYAGINATNVTFGQGGALAPTGDNDPSVSFAAGNSSGYLFVPLKSPAMYLKPPVTFECWVNSYSTAFADCMGNGGANGDGSGKWSGLRLSYNANFSGGPTLTAYAYTGSGSTYNQINAPANSLPLGSWHYCVMTYDGSDLLLYVDGVLQVTGTTSMATNYWTPLTIGTGRWDKGPTRGYAGSLDEAAVYTNVLSALQITNHYLAAITYGSNYMHTVLSDPPLLYYRMDNAYTNPSPLIYPTALNFGAAPVNGAYGSGIAPGGVSGPAACGTNAVAAPINGVYSGVDAGYDPAFDPTGRQPFTAMTWFRTYPSDERLQTLMGQGNNWAINLNTASAGGQLIWNLGSGGQVTSTNSLNDGEWHFVAGVYDGTNSYLYVDGALNNSGVATAGLTGETTADMFLGGNADYTFEQYYFGSQYFAGAIAQAAFYTNALSAVQIRTIYDGAVVPTINLSYAGGQVVIKYTGTLLSSTNVAGPYTQVVGASSSPYVVTPTVNKTFYRTSTP